MGGGRRVTSTDVARAAGVSQAVVSRAFSPEGKIADKTRAKVLSVAKKLGYHPNALARSLVTQRSGLVGVIIGDITNPFYAPVLMELSKRLGAEGREVLLLNVEDDDSLKGALERAQAYRVEAVIATAITLSSRMVETFSKSGIPVILFNRYTGRGDVYAVSCDNVAGGARVADAFIGAGHTRFAFIGGKPDTSTNRDRREGFAARLRERGFELGAAIEQAYSYRWGFEGAKALYSDQSAPDALFCNNDTVALGALDALRFELGLKVPEDVSVIGFDDIEAASWPVYALTTIRQETGAMIEATVGLLEALNENTANTSIPRNTPGVHFIPGELVVRSTLRRATAQPLETP